MLRLQAYRFELRPTGEQTRRMRQFAGCVRYVYNRGLALQKERYERGDKKLGYAGLCKELTAWRHSKETPWLAVGPVHTQQQTLKDLEKAYRDFFTKKTAFPKFKKKGRSRDSFRYPAPKEFKLDEANSRVFLPKLGWMRYRKSQDVLGELRNITVSRDGQRWFFSVQTQREVEEPRHPATSAVGIDLGVANFATMSYGRVFAPVSSYRRNQQRLATLQRRMSRKKKFSANWRKAKAKVEALHSRIAHVRKDFLHQTSTSISKNHALVVVEDLKVANMSKSAKGTVEAPGTNVRAKAGLNRAILDQGWFEFRRQLEYKQKWRGGMLIAVPPRNTSRECRVCHHVAAENRPTQAKFECVACGHREHADLNAAQVILAAGHAVLACGEAALAASAKQEPAEASLSLG